MRHFRPFLIMLIAAAALNVLVAWGCILWSPYTSHTKPSDQPTDDGYPPTVAGPFGQQGWWFSATGFGVWQSVPSGARGAEGRFLYWRGRHTPAYFRCGWPMLSFQSTVMFHDYKVRWDLPATEILRRGMQTGWLPSWLHAQPERRLPLVPFWPGFAINIVAYWGVLIAARSWWLRVLKRAPSKPDAVKTTIASRFHFGYYWRMITNPERSAEEMDKRHQGVGSVVNPRPKLWMNRKPIHDTRPT